MVYLPIEDQLEVISIESEPEDDISVISLGEARRLAQLRIDGVGIALTPISPCKITDSLSSEYLQLVLYILLVHKHA